MSFYKVYESKCDTTDFYHTIESVMDYMKKHGIVLKDESFEKSERITYSNIEDYEVIITKEHFKDESTSKIIKVDSCEHCPLRENLHDWDNHTWCNVCRHPDTDGMKIGHINIIHPDCKLEG